jgi:hypothetical protein
MGKMKMVVICAMLFMLGMALSTDGRESILRKLHLSATQAAEGLGYHSKAPRNGNFTLSKSQTNFAQSIGTKFV